MDIRRQITENDKKTLYIFTDNTNRTSGNNKIDPNSWYAKKYGENLCYPNTTNACIRGLENAYPISTQRYYDKKNNLVGDKGRWIDEDYDEFKKVIDNEINDIINIVKTNKYEKVWVPELVNGKISCITEKRTPKLYYYLINKRNNLKKFLYEFYHGKQIEF